MLFLTLQSPRTRLGSSRTRPTLNPAPRSESDASSRTRLGEDVRDEAEGGGVRDEVQGGDVRDEEEGGHKCQRGGGRRVLTH